MTINFEIKGQLAKLLATEDLVIENKNVETAMFNVETRVLTLPMWQKATNSVYDMLVGVKLVMLYILPMIGVLKERFPVSLLM